MVELNSVSTRDHRQYCRWRCQCPILNPMLTEADCTFAELTTFWKTEVDQQQQRNRSWIASNTWHHVDCRAALRRRLTFSSLPFSTSGIDMEETPQYPATQQTDRARAEEVSTHDLSNDVVDGDSLFQQGTTGNPSALKTGLEIEQEMQTEGRIIRRLLRRDRCNRAEHVSQEINSLLLSGDIRHAFHLLRAWYRDHSGFVPTPTRLNLDSTRTEFLALYKAVQSPGDSLPINVVPSTINDCPPDEEEIFIALKKMNRGKMPGPSQVCVEDLRHWHDDLPEVWAKLVKLVQMALAGIDVPAAFAYGILVLIPKSEPGKFRGIALLEVIYKLCATVIHLRLRDAIDSHPGIHGFRVGRGTGTAILEAKLLMQLAFWDCKPLYQVFLDLTKAYDSLDRVRTMEILIGYGVGPNLCRFIQTVWNDDTLVPKSGGCFGTPFQAERGVRQGDIISPIIFNIVIDCVLREWHRLLGPTTLSTLFYADDGRLAGYCAQDVQQGLDLFIEVFSRVGLQINATKTKAMIVLGQNPYNHQSIAGYKRRFDQSLPDFRARKLTKVVCNVCGKSMTDQYLALHKLNLHGIVSDGVLLTPLPSDSTLWYYIDFPDPKIPVPCPVPDCPAIPTSRDKMRRHFAWRHPANIIVIKQ